MLFEKQVSADSRYTIRCTALLCGGDVSVTVCGGTLDHIGAVSMAVYEPLRGSATVSTITAYSHRDDAVSAQIAKRFSSELHCTVTVSAGIHIDDAAKEELQLLRDNCTRCSELLLDELRVSIQGTRQHGPL